jgi:hypothetical protein
MVSVVWAIVTVQEAAFGVQRHEQQQQRKP